MKMKPNRSFLLVKLGTKTTPSTYSAVRGNVYCLHYIWGGIFNPSTSLIIGY